HAAGDAAVARVDPDRGELVLVLLEVGAPEVAETALGAGDRGHDVVVVLRGAVVLAARALLTVDLVGEVVEGAGVGARPGGGERLVREPGVDVLPALHLALGGRLPDLLELLHREALGPGVLLVHHDREGVGGDRQLGVGDALRLAGGLLLVLDRPRGVLNVGLAVAELLEAAAGAGG